MHLKAHRLSLELILTAGMAACASAATAQGIYTCVDAKGRRLTADRPITECLNREQKELNASGTVRRRVAPVLTAEEVALAEQRDTLAAQEQARAAEARRRDRALLTRYPDRASHDRERDRVLMPLERDIESATRRLNELLHQRKALETELGAHRSKPVKTPGDLKRRSEDNDRALAAHTSRSPFRRRTTTGWRSASTRSWPGCRNSGDRTSRPLHL